MLHQLNTIANFNLKNQVVQKRNSKENIFKLNARTLKFPSIFDVSSEK